MKKTQGFSTRAIHTGQETDPSTDAVIPPITLSTTYRMPAAGVVKKYDYTRLGNPNRSNMEAAVADLENAKYCCAFASGCSVTSAIINTLDSGTHIICVNDVYTGTHNILAKIAPKHQIQTSFVDMSIASNINQHFQSNTKLVWLETPTNPTMRITDIAEIAKYTHDHGSILVVDNTFLTPYFQNPLALGADIVMHSATKYINGHSDVLMGLALTNDETLYKNLVFIQASMGAVPSPFDSFLARRGMMTLAIRMKAHETNAQAVAQFLENQHRTVDQVFYPGLASHPQHHIAAKQQHGYGGMLSFKLKGNLDNVNAFLTSLKVFALAESLGGVESLVEVPSLMTHATIDPKERQALGITDTLIRMSVGIEDVEDLIEDLEQALGKSKIETKNVEDLIEDLDQALGKSKIETIV
ncbi:Cys/Met metabolism PLP-dependent enzyme-domain-containing protein [Halteromyces radiatus]|uniref:Cys/Met metabolism PLP-dependent enzyme-domain-containing protein n=1 Tax=Halteromyces radiatus TaxID=101107 RepID=UPI002220008B|nr:Cys/Met metabolism PLP-dependent enzyme-domain-containing protein [Halteromyces radiatus]KAI8084684.1 Cys/Met metabolism PLP-dependent enzyme-domain-containing protein [Halteromyces radiatus]